MRLGQCSPDTARVAVVPAQDGVGDGRAGATVSARRRLIVVDLGLTPYGEALALQRVVAQARIEGRLAG